MDHADSPSSDLSEQPWSPQQTEVAGEESPVVIASGTTEDGDLHVPIQSA